LCCITRATREFRLHRRAIVPRCEPLHVDYVIADRRRKGENTEALNRVVCDLFAGLSPLPRL